MKKGLLVALEGIDGSGTTTQLESVAKSLTARGMAVHTTAEPSRGPIGQIIRQALERKIAMSPQALALAFACDRLDHFHNEIAPKLEIGTIVLTDRYLLSSLAYQSLDVEQEWVAEINKFAPHSEISILLRIDPATAATRREKRGGAEEIFDDLEKQKRIASTYERISADNQYGQTHIVDADADREEVTQNIMKIIDALLISTDDNDHRD